MLTNEKITANKERFINELRSITRDGANIEQFIYKLENSDFFSAPASSRFHNGFEGGLCDHCLNVLDNLRMLCANTYGDNCPYSDETLVIVSLCHDMAKMNFYEAYAKNVKVYSDAGSKRDEFGKFDWHAEKAFKIKEGTDRFLYGTHGQNSEYITGSFIPLALEESVAIINHMGWEPTASIDLTGIYNKYSLACLLHVADMLSTYIAEKIW